MARKNCSFFPLNTKFKHPKKYPNSSSTIIEEQRISGKGNTQENETSQPQEEPLYQGSKISKILSFVLIVSFVLKHNLSKAAWADLLRLLTALLGEWCRRTFQSVYRMKLFMKEYFGSKEPTKINYCSNCLQQVKDRCPNDSCKGAALSSFLDLHFEEKIKDLFRDSEFLTLLKQGKEQIKRAVSSSGIHDIFHGMDYKTFLHPGGFPFGQEKSSRIRVVTSFLWFLLTFGTSGTDM